MKSKKHSMEMKSDRRKMLSRFSEPSRIASRTAALAKLRRRVQEAAQGAARNWLRDPVRTAVGVLVLTTCVVAMLSFRNYRDGEFWNNVLVEAHGMLLDILVLGIFVLWLDQRRDEAFLSQRYQEEIDDFRNWKSEEATHRIVGNIHRLVKLGVTEIDLYNCYLKNANLREANLERSRLWGADLGNANLRGVNLRG
jgi:hypothetical protein